jgi:hypothetical protein
VGILLSLAGVVLVLAVLLVVTPLRAVARAGGGTR